MPMAYDLPRRRLLGQGPLCALERCGSTDGYWVDTTHASLEARGAIVLWINNALDAV